MVSSLIHERCRNSTTARCGANDSTRKRTKLRLSGVWAKENGNCRSTHPSFPASANGLSASKNRGNTSVARSRLCVMSWCAFTVNSKVSPTF